MSAETIQTQQEARLDDVLIQAEVFVNDLRQLAADSDFGTIAELPDVDYVQYDAQTSAVDFLTRRLPAAAAIDRISVLVPAAPELTFSTADDITVPDFAGTAPSLNIPTTPSNALPTAPTAPTISDVVLPTAPTLTLPTAPTFATVNLPLPPSVDIPSFMAGLPSEDFFTPTNNFEFYEERYSSDILTELNEKLLDNLQNGGYGIETDDEADLFQRARDREVEATLAEIDEVYRSAAARGFPLPPGQLFAAEQRAQQALSNKLSGISRDIALKRSDLYVENRKFTIEQSRQLEQILIGFHNSVQERALNAAKATLDAAITIYEAQLKRYNARLDAYKSEAQVFEAKIRASLAQVEIYRTQMQGAQLELDSQKTQAELYRAQLGGIESIVNIYRAQMEAAGVQAQVERTRLESFRGLIDAYTAQVQAKVAEFGMYKAQIEGEAAKVQVYEADVRAYAAQVEGLRVRSQISLGNLQAETEQARAKVDLYRGQLQSSELDLRGQTEVINSTLGLYNADISGYKSALDALAEAYRLDQQRQRDNLDAIFKAADVKIRNATLTFEGLKEIIDTKLKASSVAQSYFTPLVASLGQSVAALAVSSTST